VKIAILLNAKAGQLNRAKCEERARELREGCAKRGVEAETHLVEGRRLTQTARELAAQARAHGIDAIVAESLADPAYDAAAAAELLVDVVEGGFLS